VQKMALEGIPSVVIGRTTSGKERILRNGEEVRYLDKPQMDEMYRVGR
jgi:hydrogenase expression/formation protein HypE